MSVGLWAERLEGCAGGRRCWRLLQVVSRQAAKKMVFTPFPRQQPPCDQLPELAYVASSTVQLPYKGAPFAHLEHRAR